MSTAQWTRVPVTDVRPGDRVRFASGRELLVSRVDRPFMGRDSMVAFIEDTPERWFKQPARADDEVEVLR